MPITAQLHDESEENSFYVDDGIVEFFSLMILDDNLFQPILSCQSIDRDQHNLP